MLSGDQSLYCAYFDLLSHKTVWLCILLVIVTCSISDVIVNVLEKMISTYKVNTKASRKIKPKSSNESQIDEPLNSLSISEKMTTEGQIRHYIKYPELSTLV